MKVARVVTIPEAFVHIVGVLSELRAAGVELQLISQNGGYEKALQDKVGARFIPVEIPREISLVQDFRALMRLIRLFRRERYDIVHSSTPKAGLLCAIAGFLTGVPVRLHTFTGQRWETLTGPKRKLLIFLDRLVGMLNTWNYADSPGQIERLVELNILPRERSSCLGSGSYGGIDIGRFEKVAHTREAARTRLGVHSDEFVVSFLGRLCIDKGIPELLEAVELVRATGAPIRLLLIGPIDEDLDPLTRQRLEAGHVLCRGFQNVPEADLVASDLFCLPSHREGFGTVVLEAAALGLPTVGTRIPGLMDAIVDQQTGVLVEKNNPQELARSLTQLAQDRQELRRLGDAARRRAVRDFSFGHLAKLLLSDYRRFLRSTSP